MKCPSCGAEASGKFCSSCGGSLKFEKCSSCGSTAPMGAKFCTNCGKVFLGAGKKSKARARAGKGSSAKAPIQDNPETNSKMAWWAAGVMLVVTLIALGYPVLTRGSGSAPAGGMGGAGAPPGMGGGGSVPVDLTTMSLEEQGRLLFNRVMTSSSNGDAADVEFFQPKAIVIYEQIAPQNPDGLYHFALIHLVGEEFTEALAKAEQGLADVPDYILLLGSAAEAAIGLGDNEAAQGYYTHLLEVYDAEMGMTRDGYDHHQAMFPTYREAAQAFLNQG
jgi:tetratricopeptide (TPR) repeat protein